MDKFDIGGIIDRRICIGHAHNGRKAPGHSRRGAGSDGFFFFIAGLPEMHMQVNQAGRYNLSGGINDHVGFLGKTADLGHFPVNRKQIGDLIDPMGRIDEPSVPNQNRGSRFFHT